MEVGESNEVRCGLLRNVRYEQRSAEMGSDLWVRRGIGLTTDLHLPIGSAKFNLQHVATLSGFRFNEGRRPAGLSEYRIVVADSADRADSATWSAGVARTTALSPAEQAPLMRTLSIPPSPPTPSQPSPH